MINTIVLLQSLFRWFRFIPMFNFYSRVLIFFIVNLIMFLRQSWYKGWHKGPVWTAWPPTQGTITSHNGWDSRTNPHPHQCNASPSRNSPNTPCLGPGHFCLIHWLPVIVTCVLTLTFQVSGTLTHYLEIKCAIFYIFSPSSLFFSWFNLNTVKKSCMRQ